MIGEATYPLNTLIQGQETQVLLTISRANKPTGQVLIGLMPVNFGQPPPGIYFCSVDSLFLLLIVQ